MGKNLIEACVLPRVGKAIHGNCRNCGSLFAGEIVVSQATCARKGDDVGILSLSGAQAEENRQTSSLEADCVEMKGQGSLGFFNVNLCYSCLLPGA